MVTDGPDLIRLSLPVDGGLTAIVEVAAGVLARRAGLSDDVVTRARSAVSAAFTEVCGGGSGRGSGEVEVEVRVEPHHLEVRIVSGAVTRTVRL